MSAWYRARADVARALAGHPEAAALLQNLDVALGVERNEHYRLGQHDAAKPAEPPENPQELGHRLEFLRLSGCSGVIAFGRLGTRFSLSDPDMMEGINRKGESVEQAVKAAFDHWEAVRPKVEA